MNEADVSRKLREELSSVGSDVVAWKISDRFHASRPDLIICNSGRFIAIEVKIHPNKPTPAQQHVLDQLTKALAAVFVMTYNKDTKYMVFKNNYTKWTRAFNNYKEAAIWLSKLHFSDTNPTL